MNRAKDWFTQAKRDLEHAKHSLDVKDYEWACFACQQSAEKAVKALFMKDGEIAWGHSVYELLEELSKRLKISTHLLEIGKRLDKFYIPPRYPNAHPEGAPHMLYTENEAREAIEFAEEVVNYCGSQGLED